MYTYLYAFIACSFPERWINHKTLLFGADGKLENQIYLEFRLALILKADQQTVKKRSLLPACSARQEQADIS